jgi:Dna[CI] antecedent, DciA
MERVGDDVARELARFGTATTLAPLVEVWPAAVGPEIARNAWPARLARDGTLHVHTSSAAWAFELRQLEARIRESLGEHAPPGLRFAVGPLPEPVSDTSGKTMSKAVRPAPQHTAAAGELTAEISDEKLRKVVAKAAALSLAKADSDRMFW